MVNKETLWMMCIETHAPNLGHLILAKAFLPSIPASEPVDSPPLCLPLWQLVESRRILMSRLLLVDRWVLVLAERRLLDE